MARRPSTFAALPAALLLLLAAAATAEQSMAVGWIPTGSRCSGSMAECLDGDEFAVDSEVSRRILDTTDYISYEALKSGTVPCTVRGASYYNCRPGAQSNLYYRGCNTITLCKPS